jgi:hypothetical protein
VTDAFSATVSVSSDATCNANWTSLNRPEEMRSRKVQKRFRNSACSAAGWLAAWSGMLLNTSR